MTIRHLFLTACLAGGAAFFTGPALSHSETEATVPTDGAVLTTPPEVIAMTFDAPMRVTLIRLTNGDGVEIAVTRSDGMEPVTEFEAIPAEMAPGAYTLEWRGLSSDGHAMEGSFSFQITN